ncbi:MAG: calcium/sodium antiporter [Polyangiales bacterium]
MTLLYASAAILTGFIAVVWGADRFVFGAAAFATNLGVGHLVIGLTVVAFGTSAPEMLVSGMAAYTGSAQMGIGNAIGSNITNTTLVLGAAALVRPLRVHSRLLIREIPVLLGIMGLAWFFLRDDSLSRIEGAVLLSGMVFLVGWIALQGKVDPESKDDPLAIGVADELPEPMPTWRAVLWFSVGLTFLLVGSRVLVWGAVGVAEGVGVSELVIGLTVVALGTSLPELAASVAAARRNEQDIAVGNVVGSNMFNLLGVLGLPGVIAPGAVVDHVLVTRDFPIMVGVTVLLLVMAMTSQHNHIGRKRGTFLVLLFGAYFVLLFLRPG